MPEAAWHRVAAESELRPEMPLGVRVGETQICLVRLEDGIHAINDVCTHEFALLSDGYCEDGHIECPLHQARFDLRTGKVVTEPATVDVATYPVKVEGGAVYVQLPG
ncbi:MAG TPA: non-heme iron oxygenase ferredoxin subunit [Crenalkalicoccus sp.]|nr:non-heme iron oxygenase ferredoxin subunit [Crenalkalicoccus sp.]